MNSESVPLVANRIGPGAKRNILHVITSLVTGGAERALVRLIAQSDRERFQHLIVSLRDEGTQGAALLAAGAELETLRIVNHAGLSRAALKLTRIARRWRPNLVHGWMYHGNLAASLAGLATGVPTIWGIRQSLHDLSDQPRATRWVIRMNALLSAHPAAILYNSRTACEHHEAYGYSRRRSAVIPNGFPPSLFTPLDPAERRELRRGLGLADGDLVFGAVARNHRVKGYDLLIAAAAAVAARTPNLRLVLCGPGTEMLVHDLPAPLRDRTLALGDRPDASRVMHAFDVYVLSSRAEAFPNCVGEAMAAGVPVVANDVGDAAEILGGTGWMVPREDPVALVDAMLAASLAADRQGRGEAARARVLDHYSLERAVSAYGTLYDELIPQRGNA
ncbi:glycosyltransferase [Methylobacterium planeticum]|uniref:Glycosyltransferase n=1 Tax=Methylobacterium planeticum TaxID=2615211 RepID=A0A6N6ML66_9HYPH|nr:glycosyltransferase [Methylobacterium planeticum]KAB1070759.1 glycosyltransferase [Methylobacterium planeticum]